MPISNNPVRSRILRIVTEQFPWQYVPAYGACGVRNMDGKKREVTDSLKKITWSAMR